MRFTFLLLLFSTNLLGQEMMLWSSVPEDLWFTGYVHCIDPTTKIVDVTSTTGEIWMDRNLGASRVAIDSADSEAYGSLFQWGRFADGHQCRNSDTTSIKATTVEPFTSGSWDSLFIIGSSDWLTTQTDTLWQGLNGTNNPCPSGYRLPTESELDVERQSWNTNNSSGAFASPLKLPTSGLRTFTNANLSDEDTNGFYWSSSVSGSFALSLHFGNNYALTTIIQRAYGFSVRCIKDLVPLYAEGTVFCDEPTKIVPVVSSTGKTWMDRNLGASQKATSSTDTSAYGDLYQWGRFSDGHQCRNSSTTTTNANTATPFSNPVWDGKFIIETLSPYDWLTFKNDNLWQGVNGVNNPCPSGYRLPTNSEWEAEDATFSPNTSVGAYISPLKLVTAGYRRYNTGVIGGVGTLGYYWSSTVGTTSARFLAFNSSNVQTNLLFRAEGQSIRCIEN